VPFVCHLQQAIRISASSPTRAAGPEQRSPASQVSQGASRRGSATGPGPIIRSDAMSAETPNLKFACLQGLPDRRSRRGLEPRTPSATSHRHRPREPAAAKSARGIGSVCHACAIVHRRSSDCLGVQAPRQRHERSFATSRRLRGIEANVRWEPASPIAQQLTASVAKRAAQSVHHSH
jgi:hypothetical protein